MGNHCKEQEIKDAFSLFLSLSFNINIINVGKALDKRCQQMSHYQQNSNVEVEKSGYFGMYSP